MACCASITVPDDREAAGADGIWAWATGGSAAAGETAAAAWEPWAAGSETATTGRTAKVAGGDFGTAGTGMAVGWLEATRSGSVTALVGSMALSTAGLEGPNATTKPFACGRTAKGTLESKSITTRVMAG